jgi:hypothetical protein
LCGKKKEKLKENCCLVRSFSKTNKTTAAGRRRTTQSDVVSGVNIELAFCNGLSLGANNQDAHLIQ